MLKLADYDIISIIYEDAVTCVYRATEREQHTPVILKTLRAATPRPKHLARLRHEYAVLSDLDFPGVARPLALLAQRHSLVLVQEDIGGVPLTDLIAQGACPLTAFLPIALALTDILDQVHRHQIIHRDLKPSNIIINQATGQVQLIDFGLASRLSREHPQLTPPDQIEGTLAYIAPEQTGRMNRTVDYRADFYALGVTFYQLLTGQLPFTAQDALEWVHCHIARPPRPPNELLPSIPPPLADVVLKLMAKLAEARYQSATGLRADLLECQRQWTATGQIMPFILGATDVSDRFQLPQQLYGRETEVATLLATFARVAATGRPEVVLIAGYSGIGKSALVAELHKSIVQQQGYFIGGKFDQYRRDIPYATLAAAFQALTQQVLAESEERVTQWRQHILDAVGDNGQIILNFIPQVGLIIGPQPALAELPPDQARHRLHTVFRNFVSLFTSAAYPLVLFLDDLQWLDAASLTLLTQLMIHRDTHYLLLIGAYRDNEVGPAHLLLGLLDKLRQHSVRVETIKLPPLTEAHVGQILADTLHCDEDRAAPLAQLVFAKTQGNPFFCFQFVTALYQDGLLVFDPDRQGWTWNVADLQTRSFTDNVVALMLGELHRLPPATQQALALAGFLGNHFTLATLTLVGEQSADVTEAYLWPALQVGLLTQSEGSYRFLHDRVQEAAYVLTPPEQRAVVHAHIGRLLRDQTPPEELADQLFDIVTHLNQGAALLTDPTERLQVAALNLRAGSRAYAALVYAAAAGYLAAGMALLPADSWSSAYDLTSALYRYRAGCEFLSGNFGLADELLNGVLTHAHTNLDRVHAYQIKIHLYTTQGDIVHACDMALASLRELNVALPVQPTREQAQQAYNELITLLGTRPIKSLIDLPPLTDPEVRLVMQGIESAQRALFFLDRNLLVVLLCHTVKLSLRYGHSEYSIRSYAYFGYTLAGYFQEYQMGYTFGELAYDLMERQGGGSYRGHIQLMRGLISVWIRPLSTMVALLQDSFQASVGAGDIIGTCYCCNHLVVAALLGERPLAEAYQEAERLLALVQQAQYRDFIDTIQMLRQHTQLLRGQTRDPASFSDDTFDETQFEAQLTPNRAPLIICAYHLARLIAYCIMGNNAAAYIAARKAQPLLWTIDSLVTSHEYMYYDALTLAARYEQQPTEIQLPDLARLRAHQQQLRRWADNNPAIFAPSHALVAAEIARITGQDLEARQGYEQAIQLARRYGFIQREALAYERAALFYHQRNFATIAETYLREAYACYARWGADGKLRQMEEHYPELRDLTGQTSLRTSSTSVAQLDMLAIVKAAQAISGQIVRDQLLQTLLELVLEQAGAQFGALLLADGDDLALTATASVKQQQVQVQLHQPADAAVALPRSILAYVQRSGERVLLDDANTPHPFATDDYLMAQRPYSVLCLPILRQGVLSGVLYLEHYSITHVFTLERLAVLEQLAAQAAVSLENAQLYAQLADYNRTLEQKVAERTGQLQAANQELEAFSYTVSHDLRAPLRAIDTYSRILIEGYAGVLDTEGRRLCHIITAETERTGRMIDDLLAFSHLNRVSMRTALIEMTSLVRQAFDEVSQTEDPSRLEFRLDALPAANADPALIRQVWVNLLANAVKYSSKRPLAVIRVEGSQANGEVTYRVQDNGAGFEMRYANKLFGVFQRLHREQDFPGTGVGLAIVQRIIQRHGGRIWADSVVDQGTTFYFTLPERALAN